MIAIIPARSGSKGLPGKNVKNLVNKPLIAYTVEEALRSKHISDVIISTDCPEIENIALEYGAKSFFLRPVELASDDSKVVDSYVYTVTRLNSSHGYDIKSFVVLQPTSPLRIASDIDGAVELFETKAADSVISVVEESHPVSWHKYLLEDGRFQDIFENTLANRQDLRLSYYPNGAVYVFSVDLVKSGRYYSDNSFAYLMPRERSVDIDTLEDFQYAEFLIGSRQCR